MSPNSTSNAGTYKFNGKENTSLHEYHIQKQNHKTRQNFSILKFYTPRKHFDYNFKFLTENKVISNRNSKRLPVIDAPRASDQ